MTRVVFKPQTIPPAKGRSFLVNWIVVTSLVISFVASSGASVARADENAPAATKSTIEDESVVEPEAESEPIAEVDPSLETAVDQESDPADAPSDEEQDAAEPELPTTDQEVDEDPTIGESVEPENQSESNADGEPPSGSTDSTDADDAVSETDDAADGEVEDEEVVENEPTTGDDSSGPTPSPEPRGILRYSPSENLDCKQTDDVAEPVTSGGFVDFSCAFGVALSGEHLNSAKISLLWSINTAISTGWSVQFLDPNAVTDADPTWSEESVERGGFDFSTTVPNVPDELNDTQSIQFGLRLHRARCETALPQIEFNAVVTPKISGVDATIIPPSSVTAPLVIAPELAPIPEPTLTFGGSLDFGTVEIDAFGVRKSPAPQNLTVTISDLDRACGIWTLELDSGSLTDVTNDPLTSASLNLVAIDGTETPEGSCDLTEGCVIASVESGPDVEPTKTFVLSLALHLPEQISASTFNSTLSASLTRDAEE